MWVEEVRRAGAALKIAVLYRQSAPLIEYVVSDSVSAVTEFANRDAVFQTTGLFRSGKDYNIGWTDLFLAGVGILMALVGWNVCRAKNTLDDEQAN